MIRPRFDSKCECLGRNNLKADRTCIYSSEPQPSQACLQIIDWLFSQWHVSTLQPEGQLSGSKNDWGESPYILTTWYLIIMKINVCDSQPSRPSPFSVSKILFHGQKFFFISNCNFSPYISHVLVLSTGTALLIYFLLQNTSRVLHMPRE